MALTAIARSEPQTEKVTVEQLERMVAAAQRRPDAKIEQRLTGLELSERLSSARLARLQAQLPGVHAQRALLALADASEFLQLPSADIPGTPAPDPAAQASLFALTRDYVEKSLPSLPNFFATRDTIHFMDLPSKPSRASGQAVQYQPLHEAGISSVTVLFRDGKEVVDAGEAMKRHPSRSGQELTTEGVFGPALELILADVLQPSLAWSHWERGADGTMAVFDYSVPLQNSHYKLVIPADTGQIYPFTGYHGQIGVDPADGAVLRLTLVADLKPTGPIAKAEILVEYGSVEIGGKTYICPLRSVAVSLARPLDPMHDFYGFQRDDQGPWQLELNDVVFRQYHLFRSELRILSGDSGNPPQLSTPASTDGSGPALPSAPKH
jgi:hypothetical protein